MLGNISARLTGQGAREGIHCTPVPHRLIPRFLQWLLALAYLMVAHTAAAQQCAALFSDGLQAHARNGQVNFGWNAELLKNPDSVLAASRVQTSGFFSLNTCESEHCRASGTPAAHQPLPEFLVRSSQNDLTVPWNGTLALDGQANAAYRTVTLAPFSTLRFHAGKPYYYIDRLSTGYGATLILTPGNYWIKHLDLGDLNSIRIDGQGSVRLFVDSAVHFRWETDVNADSQANWRSPQKLFVYSSQSIKLDVGATVSGYLYAEKAAELSALSSLRGGFNGSTVTLKTFATAYYDAPGLALADETDLCDVVQLPDLDADGIPDDRDDDRDGDGFDNAIEEQVGTDPNDPTSLPVDANNNGIPDGLENGPTHDYVNACMATFPNGLQSLTPKGDIHFQYNAQLLDASSPGLFTHDVKSQRGAGQATCGDQFCYATDRTVSSFTLTPFKQSTRKGKVNIAGKGKRLGDDGAIEFPTIQLKPSAELTFSSQNAEYLINNLELGHRSKLFLPAGVYWINELKLENETQLQVIGEGTVRLFVKKGVQVGSRALINSPGEGQSGNPAELLIISQDEVKVGEKVALSALLFSVKEVQVGWLSRVFGAITADHIRLASETRVHYRPDAVAQLDFGSLCDLDADGIYDGKDNDLDGDGYSNQDETAAGSNPYDPGSIPGIPPADMDNDGIPDDQDPDRDGDGISNEDEVQLGTNPNDPASTPPDSDGDGIPDALETDRDGDGVSNDQDPFPDDATEWADLDNDGIGDNSDLDRDGDGISNVDEIQLGTDPNNPASTPPDRDGDGIPDALEADRDEDGVLNEQDKFPDDPNEWADLDNDGIGDNSDTDRDGDGYPNDLEVAKGTDPNHAADYPDTQPPSLVLYQTSPVNTEADIITLSGAVADPLQPHAGVASVSVSSDRYPGVAFAGAVSNGAFRVEIPLKVELNTLTITALDLSRNATSAELVVDRDSPPRFVNVTPLDGTLVTEPTITIAGEVHTLLPLTAVRFSVNDWQITPIGTGQTGQYRFDLPNVPVDLGLNQFALTVETSDGLDSRTFTVDYRPAGAEQLAAPLITILSPPDGSLISGASFPFAARVTSAGGPLHITVNGEAVALPVNNMTAADVQTVLDFPEGAQTMTVSLSATDSLNKVSTVTSHYHRDSELPLILLNSALSPAPTVNAVVQSPYEVTGTLVDANLSSFLVNDKPIGVRPGTTVGSYDFAFAVELASGQTLPLNLVARDLAGNQTSAEYMVQSTATASLTALVPAEGAQFIGRDAPINVQVVARVEQLQAGDSVSVQVNPLPPVTLMLAGTLASGEMALPFTAGAYTLTFRVHNTLGSIIASTQRQVTVQNDADVPLAVVRMEPANGQRHVETNAPLELYFNKPIDLAKLTVSVRETLHGDTYLNSDPLGLDFLQAKGYQLQAVHRDLEPVTGNLQLLPGATTVAFYASRAFGFKADVYVDVQYDGQELARSTFTLRALPTFVMGSVRDQFGQPLAGITVQLPELERSTLTNGDGGFAFGFQDAPEQIIPGGRHRLLINPGLRNSGFGSDVRTTNLQQGRKNAIGAITLPELHREIPFQVVEGGRLLSLAGDALQLDLTQSELVFPDGRASGKVHVQFMPFEQLSVQMLPNALPLWVYAVQPRGIEVSGPLRLTLQIPKLSGSFDYLPDVYRYVVLLGYRSDAEVLEPIGVGKIDNTRIISVGPVSLGSLDYVGYAQVSPANTALLEAVAAGDLSLQQLKAQLQ